MIRFKFKACRAAQRDLWDYAGERLAEGPMEQVERHLETCAACRREAAQWKRAQDLLETAQSAPLPTARLGWNDLQDRIAADVAAFGPPRPDKRHTRQAVSQLIRPRRAVRISFLRPALAGGMAIALAAGVLMTHRAPKTAAGESNGSIAPVIVSAGLPAPLAPPAGNTALSALTTNAAIALAPSSASASENAAPLPEKLKSAKPVAVKIAPQNRIAAAPALSAKSKSVKAAAKTAPPRAIAANHSPAAQDDGAMKLRPHEPTPEEKAPDESEVADGVIGTLVPVSHDDNGYY